MALDIGTEYAITATVTKRIDIPIGDEGVGQTLVNDGTDDIFWRERDPSLNDLVGIASVLIAAPFLCSRLRHGEFIHKAGITIDVVCATTESSTLRVVPGRLYQSNNSIADVASVLYDGAGSDGVNNDDLVEYATAALLIAGLSGMTVIDADGKNALDIYLANSVAAQNGTILVSEYSAGTPTVATQIRSTEISVPVIDNASTVDRNMFGLATGTEYPAKAPIRVSVTPGSFILLSLAADLAGGIWYARYQLHGSV